PEKDLSQCLDRYLALCAALNRNSSLSECYQSRLDKAIHEILKGEQHFELTIDEYVAAESDKNNAATVLLKLLLNMDDRVRAWTLIKILIKQSIMCCRDLERAVVRLIAQMAKEASPKETSPEELNDVLKWLESSSGSSQFDTTLSVII